MTSIEDALNRYSRVSLTRVPTPLDHLIHLQKEIGLNLYLKRDDLTDLTLGGDKPRKLEYELARARENGADIIVTCGSMQSNMARLTTAAARKLGMDCALVLSQDPFNDLQGNLMTVRLMGAQVRVIETDDHWDLEQYAFDLCDELRQAGRCPHYIPVSGSTPHSSLGYVRGTLELIGQLEEAGVTPQAVYTPFGTGGIFTSVLSTLRQKGYECPVIGISINRQQPESMENFQKWWEILSELLALDPNRPTGPYEIYDEFIGKEYGDATEAGLDAILLMGGTEGILLDPVYSGKVFSGIVAQHAAGRWTPDQPLVMLHSGGVPALFAYRKEIEAHLEKRGLL
ncbi:MAG: pyridoxal-phosphate dependent enzyme [Chloroflexota bacterium]